MRWAEHAWATLTEAGLTSYTTEVERTLCVLRGVALGALYRDFSALAFDEGSPEDWREEVGSDVIGPFPLIDLFTLGQLVERKGYDVDHNSFDDGREIAEVLGDLVDAQYAALVPELRRRMDYANLFASLFASHDAAVAYPLTKDQVSEIVNTHVTGNKMATWEWLTQGRCSFLGAYGRGFLGRRRPMPGTWNADPSSDFLQRIGKSAHDLGTTGGNASCPDIWELANGDVAVIGTQLRAEYLDRLPAGVTIDDHESLVVIPRSMLIAAKADIPDV